MFRSLRRARSGQMILLVAGFLAVSGSFGLHPEPERSAGPATAREGWNALDRSVETSSHVCFACLAHRSISLSRLAAVVLRPGSTVHAAPVTASSPLKKLEAHPRDGRAPPALI